MQQDASNNGPPSQPLQQVTVYQRPSYEKLLVVVVMAVLGAGVARRLARQDVRPTPPPAGAQQVVESAPASAINGQRSVSASGSSSGAELQRTVVPTLLSAGNQLKAYAEAHALVVGNSRYKHSDAWSNLPGVIQDVKKVKAALQKAGFQVEVKENLTGQELQSAFEHFALTYGSGESQQKNCLLVYYAGHGCTLKSNWGGQDRPYLVGTDAPAPDKRDDFAIQSYDMSYFANLSEQIQAKHAIFLFDSCFSGNFFDARRAQVPTTVKVASSRHVRQFITSGSAGETVADDSEFCRQFIAALRGNTGPLLKPDVNDDQYLTGTELGMYLSQQVSTRTQGRQKPVAGKSVKPLLAEGDFLFPLDAAPVMPPEEARPADPGKAEWESTNSLGMSFRKIGRSNYKAVDARQYDPLEHASVFNRSAKVDLTDYVYFCRHEVRWRDYLAIMGRGPDALPSGGADGNEANYPVTHVTWKEAREFCRLLTEKERKADEDKKLPDDWEYRLPWEAEWDMAALELQTREIVRCDDMGGPRFWAALSASEKLHETELEAPNRMGFHDLEGNVLEWCYDYFVPGLPQDEMKNPRGTFDGDSRVVRGRTRQLRWLDENGKVRMMNASLRLAGFAQETALPRLGFRIVKAPVDTTVPGEDDDPILGGQVPKFVSQFFLASEYDKGKVGDEKEGEKLRKSILDIALNRLFSAGYATVPKGAVDSQGYVSRELRQSLRNFQWINRLPTTDTLNDETLKALVLNNLTPETVGLIREVAAPTPSPGHSSSPTRVHSSGSSEPEWIRNSGIRLWLPYAAGGASRMFR